MRSPLKTLLWYAFVAVALLFVMAPILVLVFSSFDDSNFFRFPPRQLSLRWYGATLGNAEYQRSLLNSAVLGLVAAAISLSTGSMAALAIVRSPLRRTRAVEALLLAPLLLPLIVWAIALLQVYARVGLSSSLFGLILAHATITVPYTVRIMIATLGQIDANLELAALSLGARPGRVLARITLPLALPGLITSAAFSFLVSFNDVIVSSFIAGATWITFPVRLYAQLRGQGIDPITLAIGALIIAGILILVLMGEILFKWSRRL